MTQALIDLVPVVVAGGIVLKVTDRMLQREAKDKTLPTRKKVSKIRASYVSKSQVEGQSCSNCEFFKSGQNTCEIVKGKISPKGWSKYWLED